MFKIAKAAASVKIEIKIRTVTPILVSPFD